MKGAYYNEIDPYAAQWIRNLIEAGLLPAGEVDERSIEDVRPDDIRGFAQCHFFAGIGVWAYALRCVGWPDDKPVWSGSCPCQPFSAAGESGGFADERHLWPAWNHLIIQCRPVRIYGEQVASKLADAWLDLVQNDLEAVGYAVGAVPFPSASVGAPHIRDRLYWMADAMRAGWTEGRSEPGIGPPAGRSEFSGVAYPLGERRQGDADGTESRGGGLPSGRSETSRLAYPNLPVECPRRAPSGEQSIRNGNGAVGQIAVGGLAYANGGRLPEAGRGSVGRIGESGASQECATTGPVNGFWRDADWITCRDGLWRPVEPGTFPLVNGVASRMDKLRAFGNAINARQAIEFIKATL